MSNEFEEWATVNGYRFERLEIANPALQAEVMKMHVTAQSMSAEDKPPTVYIVDGWYKQNRGQPFSYLDFGKSFFGGQRDRVVVLDKEEYEYFRDHDLLKVLSVPIAHEMGHYYAGHVLPDQVAESDPDYENVVRQYREYEFEADAIGVRLLGSNSEGYIAALEVLNRVYGQENDVYHPSIESRSAVIRIAANGGVPVVDFEGDEIRDITQGPGRFNLQDPVVRK